MLNRSSLVTEVSNVIRKAIAESRYGSTLPAERHLAAELGVSRPTVRAALAVLEREKVIKVHARQRRAIAAGARRAAQSSTLSIRLLHDGRSTSYLTDHLSLLEYLAENLPAPRYSFHPEASPACFSTNPGAALQRLVATQRTDLWVLYLSTQPMQEWFERRKIPAIVLGSKFPGVALPSADEDFRAVCRHAAGLLIARGHRRIALLLRKRMRAGDISSREGFLEAFAQSPCQNLGEPVICEHDETTAGICRVTTQLAELRPRPTAIIVGSTWPYLTVQTQLARLGLRVPENISLICRNSDPVFDAIVPPPAHYRRNEDIARRKLLKLIFHSLHGGRVSDIHFASDFSDGDSLASVRV